MTKSERWVRDLLADWRTGLPETLIVQVVDWARGLELDDDRYGRDAVLGHAKELYSFLLRLSGSPQSSRTRQAKAPLMRAPAYLLSPEEGFRVHLTAEATKQGGEGPAPPKPLRVQLGQRIVLEVEAWISPESVRSIFRAAQQQVHGKRFRGLSTKALLRFEFWNQERAKAEKRKPTWRTLFERWKNATPFERSNTGQRARRRCKTWRQFRRSCLATEEALLRPKLAKAYRDKVRREEEDLVTWAKAVGPLTLSPLVPRSAWARVRRSLSRAGR